MLDRLDLAAVGRDAETWEKVARKLRTHEMPPPGLPRPDQATYDTLATKVEAALDAAAAATPHPGRVAVHRLNRTEYANAIRDLLALDVNGRALLPADEPDQQGFDNVAGVLSVSPRLLENYLAAASTVSRLAVGDSSISAVEDTFRIPTAMVQDDRAAEDLPFGSRGGIDIPYQFPLDGDYTIKVVLKRQLYLYLMGMGEPHQIDVRLDGALLKRFTIGGEGQGRTAPESFAGNTQGDPQWEEYMHTADAGLIVRVPVTAGAHHVGVSFVKRYWEPEGILQPPQRGFARTTNERYFGNPSVDSVAIAGPLAARASADSPSRRRVFICRPANRAAEEPCARRILSTLARRAYRGPVADADVNELLAFYRTGRSERRVDSTPAFSAAFAGSWRHRDFCFASSTSRRRAQSGPARIASAISISRRGSRSSCGAAFRTRSSSTAAIKGTLSDRATLEQQVRRMLADPRSQALVDNFAMQWLTSASSRAWCLTSMRILNSTRTCATPSARRRGRSSSRSCARIAA